MAVAKSEKPGFIERTKRYFRNMVQEMKKVVWPGKRDLAVYTAVVIGASLVLAAVIWMLDLGIGAIMGLIIK